MKSLSDQLEKHIGYERLRDRAFDFIEDPVGRSTFLPQELTAFCNSFVALDIPTDTKIFEQICYEAISRIKQ